MEKDYTMLLRKKRVREVLSVVASVKEMLLHERANCKARSDWEVNIKQNNTADELLVK